MKKSILILLTIMLIVACARQRQLWLFELKRTHEADKDKVVRIYFDKDGSLYPDKNFMIPYKIFFGYKDGGNTYKEKRSTGSLKQYYLKNASDFSRLLNRYGLASGTANNSEGFEMLQKAIKKEVSDLIKNELNKKNPKLIVMIHGFNDPNPTGDYQQLRDSIRSLGHDKGEYIYLEVYWDGLTCNQGNPALSKIWGKAQANSARVAISLRGILNQLPKTTKLRIITHSMGAGVGTGVLFNTVRKWKHPENYQYEQPPDFEDMRIGMYAAAIPGESTFCDFALRGKDTIKSTANKITRIVLGYNMNDLALTKLIRVSGKFGSTSLGCNRKGKEIKNTKEVLNCFFKDTTKVNEVFRDENFTEFPKRKSEEHGLYYYLLRTTANRNFLDKLFI